MADIFLSYRRNDSPGFAGRLSEALESALGEGSVFRDVDDIRSGQDFVGVIERELGSVGVTLVMIGPAWLAACRTLVVDSEKRPQRAQFLPDSPPHSPAMGQEAGEKWAAAAVSQPTIPKSDRLLEARAEGKRRLEDPEDFVRLEVLAALASGKPVIPVLVNGAVMPREADLPEALRALTRRQAFSLSDANWKADVVRLVADIRPLLPRRAGAWRRRWPLLAGVALALAVAVGIALWPRPPAVDIAGRWTAKIKYDWGAEYQEAFEFQVRDGQVRGSAGFLRLPRSIAEGRLEGRRLSFVTRGDEVLGDGPPRERVHRYQGEVADNTIRFTLETQGGYSRHPPVEFVARRSGE